MAFFEETFVLSSSEADLHQRIKLSAVLRHMQDAASHHLTALGFPPQRMQAAHQVFLLSKVEIQFAGSPLPDQQVTVFTRPHPPKGAFFLRETNLAVEGRTLITGKAAWVLADDRTHQVLRPSVFDWEDPFDPVEFDGAIARRRLHAPEHVSPLGVRRIRYSDLDGNRHMNNAVYGDILFDFLPAEWSARPLRQAVLIYEHEAFLGDELAIAGAPCGIDSWYLAGHRGGARCFSAELQFDRG